jgi:hypothetical protein
MVDWINPSTDDPLIVGQLRLLRRVPTSKIKAELAEADSDNFRHANDQDTGWSCTIWDNPSDLDDILRFHNGYCVVRIYAEDLRNEGLTITRRPLVGNLNHCEVFGDMTKQKKARRLRKLAPWVHWPSSIVTTAAFDIEEF